MVSIRTDCRIIGEAYHKIPSILWSHDTMITDLPSPLTSRPSGPDNNYILEVLFMLTLSVKHNEKIIAPLGTLNTGPGSLQSHNLPLHHILSY